MYISHIKLFNWKNFHECEVNLSERCFIIGANAVGKSNFLDALRFLRDITKQGGGLQSAVDSRGGVTKIRSLSARTRTDVGVEVILSDSEKHEPIWKYRLYFRNTGGGIKKNSALVKNEEVFDYRKGEYTLQRDEKEESEDQETLKFTHLEQATANTKFREVKDAFQALEYLNVIPQLVRESSSVMISTDKEDYYGRNFLQRMSILPERTRSKYLRLINEVLAVAVPQLEKLSFVKDEMGVPHIEATYKHWRARGSKQNEMLFSDGTLRLIGFLFAMLDGTGIILLEEPEINLHSEIVAQIPAFVSRIQRNKHRQVIITTHSYDILSNNGIGMKELVVLMNTKEGTLVKNGIDIDVVRDVMNAGLSAADATISLTRPENIENMNHITL